MLRSAPLLRRGALRIRGPEDVGPGSAEQREERCTASGTRVPHTAGFGNPLIAHAARSVLTSRHATVICPTPPGTGVIAPATCNASLKATSPTSRVLPSAAGKRLMPTSITVAPGLIQLPRTISGLPTAA